MNASENIEGRPDMEDCVREAAAFMLLLEDSIGRCVFEPGHEIPFTDATMCGLSLLRRHVEDRLFQAFYGRSNSRYESQREEERDRMRELLRASKGGAQ